MNRMTKRQCTVLVILSMVVLLSGCIHFIVPSVMLEVKQLHDMSALEKRICQLEKEFCQQ